MTNLENLISEFCPNGVVYSELKDVAKIAIGEFVHKNKQTIDGQYPVYNGGTANTGFYDDFNRTANKIIISARGAMQDMSTEYLQTFGLEIAAIVLTLLIAMLIGIMSITA